MAKSLTARAAVRVCAPLCIAAALAACAVGPNFHRPAAPTDSGYEPGPSAAIGSGVDTQQLVADLKIPEQWWSLFQSPKLDQLLADALRASPDVDAAKAALRRRMSCTWRNVPRSCPRPMAASAAPAPNIPLAPSRRPRWLPIPPTTCIPRSSP
jgi:hypothetical protein